MSKRTAKRPKSNKNGIFQGIGYVRPANMSKARFEKLYKLWDKKLKNSGHCDTETVNVFGRSSVFFVQDQSRGIYLQENYNATHFFSLIQTYLTYFAYTDSFRSLFGDNAPYFRILLQAYADGESLTNILKLNNSRDFHIDKNTGKFSEVYFNRNKKRSKFYIYTKLREILHHCWFYHCLDQNGELDIGDLHRYNFLGLDIKGTKDLLNSIRERLCMPPVSKMGVEEVALHPSDRSMSLDEVLSSVVLRDFDNLKGD